MSLVLQILLSLRASGDYIGSNYLGKIVEQDSRCLPDLHPLTARHLVHFNILLSTTYIRKV